ncbi:glycosyl hydrolase 115 family protein [Paenibacillus tengchongensis]|uniref:glycosyl hydrolase 115 family protein n=1 Tax=Paenibacillus tengchongensis TaxID=2608684 RepID=UPI00124DE407|nr:glycosyl hydrolase 115 family protein [Paenibacillus tengchongensis]
MFTAKFIGNSEQTGYFPLVHGHIPAALLVAPEEPPGIRRAAQDLVQDISRVTGVRPQLISRLDPQKESHGPLVIIGTVQDQLIGSLITDGKLDAAGLAGKWESFVIQTVSAPAAGLDQALVIAGSDRRGAIYGIYELSGQIGVSPWYWWADVPVPAQESLYVKPGVYKQGEPSVKYRGIFLNDEGPSLMAWVRDNFGDFGHSFYEKVFELLLRLKANFLWPAMWDNTFYEDDERNAAAAYEYGIIMGTSHHEPMQRPHGDWKKHKKGPWDYAVNKENLYPFWQEGIRRSAAYENIVTIGMRGDGDEAMGGDLTFEGKIALLERIVEDQRTIIAQETGREPADTPQLWALYKEVQDYYNHGMTVPDDVTLLWSDDNHGNLRRVPAAGERSRPGGAGIYYHLDYVGGPRSYKWLCTVPLPKIWEQMHKAYTFGADRIWVLNVGDLKPMEFPLEYFLRLAWNINAFTADNIKEYAVEWSIRQFGAAYGEAAADILLRYTKYNGRLKPELLNAVSQYSLLHYNEAETVVSDFNEIAGEAERLYREMPEAPRDAFYQLVLYPAKASATVLELHLRAARSLLYAKQGRAAADSEAAAARRLFEADAELTYYYNHVLAGGKWNHMMDQTHIGYTYWNQPPVNEMPELGSSDLLEGSEMGIAVEGSELTWPSADGIPCRLPEFSVYAREKHYIEIFNKRRDPFAYSVESSAPWILLSTAAGEVTEQTVVWVEIDWALAPVGYREEEVALHVSGPEGVSVPITVVLDHPAAPKREEVSGHIESGGFISIEAEHYTARHTARGAQWQVIPDYGRTLSAVAVFPPDIPAADHPEPAGSPSLEYRVYLRRPGKVVVSLLLAPSLNFVPGSGLRAGVSFDGGPVTIAAALQPGEEVSTEAEDWEHSVIYNIRTASAICELAEAGYHTLRIWMVDPIAVLQKIIIDTGGLQPSYLGPPESYYRLPE